jgi:DinB superfamily
MDARSAILALFDQGFEKAAWHGPNLWQSLKGVTAKQAAWRPAPGRHNIWEETLHAAYWKYAARRKLAGGKRGAFVLKGSNFFPRPEPGKLGESAWRADKAILRREHEALRRAVIKTLAKPVSANVGRMLWGVAFHDVYHAGQIRLLRRLMA